ncbi:acyl carrier protein [Bacillus wiedmannii]|uniref:acyl carrier protein n=1 Tax=Bacillus wiedmannii TaxID=1890302 RepID=UPI000BF22857|nr:acyl carrier protein [Bacillus wiedmannii]PEL51557.1 hypothetical protein CN622_30225 [Bacillus wiedmannii]PEO05790.1 hypothetical protein CN562_29610 [Bacillus wiedmannii]PEP99148.1 hypothetical protein CN587_29740 [Bacillus wiedmannii]
MDNHFLQMQLRNIIKLYTDITVPIDEVDLDEDLFSIGMDSLSCMKVIIAIEETFEMEVDEDDLLLENFESIFSMQKYIISKL